MNLLANKIVIFLIIFIIVIVFAFFKGKTTQKNQDILIEQNQEIQIQNQIIHENKIVKKRQSNNVSTPINPALEWLRSKRCEDC